MIDCNHVIQTEGLHKHPWVEGYTHNRKCHEQSQIFSIFVEIGLQHLTGFLLRLHTTLLAPYNMTQ